MEVIFDSIQERSLLQRHAINIARTGGTLSGVTLNEGAGTNKICPCLGRRVVSSVAYHKNSKMPRKGILPRHFASAILCPFIGSATKKRPLFSMRRANH